MRNISKQDFFEILNLNCSFVETEIIGIRSLELSSYEAFIFSTITGAQYLDDLVFPFTPKGLMKVFHSHLNDRFVTGLWSGVNPHFSPLGLVSNRPFLQIGPKYLIPVSFSTENEFKNEVQDLYNKQKYAGEFIIHRIEASKEGGGQEGLLEYLSCEYFRNKGYLVDSQIPLAQQYGSPDWMAISPFLLFNNFEIFRGKYLFELGMSGVNWDQKPNLGLTQNDLTGNFIVGEAKVAAGDPTKQISKYKGSGLFTRAVLSVTDRQDRYLGLCDQFYLDQSWEPRYLECESISKEFNRENSSEFGKFLITLSKFYLLSNFETPKMSTILGFDISNPLFTQSKLLSLVRSIPLANFLVP